MRALLSRIVGGPECLVIGEIADPVPKADEVLVRVKACGVNYPDTLIIRDQYQYKPPRPFAPGGEIAGIVIGLGEAVEGLQIGDHVLALLTWGGMAEIAAVPSSRVVRIPKQMPFEDAAALTMTYATSYHALKDRAVLLPGETLLVLGAGGGVGLAAVELGIVMGAKVIAAASSAEKVEAAVAHGASSGIVYPSGPFEQRGRDELARLFKNACGTGGANVIYDPVGGDYSEAALRAIAWRGRYLVVGFPAGIARIPLNLPLLKGCAIIGVFTGSFATRQPNENAENMRQVLALYEQGKIRPTIAARFPLDLGADAITRLAARQVIGKIVITIDE
jgi:NADPH2:quinone reductase